MSGSIEVRVNDVGDILYLRFKQAKIAACREFGDLRNIDYDTDGALIGVELIGLPGGGEPTRAAGGGPHSRSAARARAA